MNKRVLALLLAIFSPLGFGQDKPQEFLSWYDGWGTHTVWGAGTISGSYRDAHVNCGGTMVVVRAIFDTHESRGTPPSPNQTAEFAAASNTELLKVFEARGDKCAFAKGG
jgi:hypothetical protein